jgi:hypothetical protein
MVIAPFGGIIVADERSIECKTIAQKLFENRYLKEATTSELIKLLLFSINEYNR